MERIRGNIVDVLKEKIFFGILTIDAGIVLNIEEIGSLIPGEKYILPGFIDSHVHIESSMLVPSSFATAAAKQGTVAVVSDPHEIANVLGIDGVNFMIENGNRSILKFFWGVPSCVPATLFETSGAVIDSKNVEDMFCDHDFVCLSEMMNFPGVVNDDEEVMKKIMIAHKYQKPIDGHAPGLKGEALKKYVTSGISTDHECSSLNEAEEKIKMGVKIQIREGSSAKNFDTLYSLIEKYPDMVMLCCDDIHPDDLIRGHINRLVALGVSKNIDFFKLLRSATLNPVSHYGLHVGLLQVGDPADFIVVKDLITFDVFQTWINGICVYRVGEDLKGKMDFEPVNKFISYSLTVDDLKVINKFKVFKAIEVMDKNLFTRSVVIRNDSFNSYLESNVDKDLLKIVVVNRYKKEKPVIGFVKNFGLKEGAISSSVAHDSHNIIAVGVNDDDILKAISLIMDAKGGIAVVDETGSMVLPLPVAGLMSPDSPEIVAQEYLRLNKKTKELGTSLSAPFMTMSFLALLVIPELKICDKGLFDVTKFQFTDLFI